MNNLISNKIFTHLRQNNNKRLFLCRHFYTDFFSELYDGDNDFHRQNIRFDPIKLRNGLQDILKIRDFDETLKIPHFGAIPLNQIPGVPGSITGHNTRGQYWTYPNSSGEEESRDVLIDESKYTEFIEDYNQTYLKDVYDELSNHYTLGRVRLLLKQPRSTLSWHRDPQPHLHIPIVTNPGCIMVIDDVAKHMPADGSVWVTNNEKYHNFFNGGEENRVHIVASILDYKF